MNRSVFEVFNHLLRQFVIIQLLSSMHICLLIKILFKNCLEMYENKNIFGKS